MQKIGKFNDISPELEATIPKLADKQVVRFHMLNGAENLHPETEQVKKHPVIYPQYCITLKDRIKDPFKKGNENYVDIGVYSSQDDKKPIDFVTIMPWNGQNPFSGTFFLIGGRANDEEVFQFLFLSNKNASNPYRDQTVEAVYEIVDPNKDARKKTGIARTLGDALNIANEMTKSEKESFAASLLWPADLTDEMLDGKISEFVMADPSDFVKRAVDPNTKIKAIIKKACDLEAITYDPATGKIFLSGNDEAIALVDRKEGVLWIDMFAEHITKHKDGTKIFDAIKKRLKTVAPVV